MLSPRSVLVTLLRGMLLILRSSGVKDGLRGLAYPISRAYESSSYIPSGLTLIEGADCETEVELKSVGD